MKSAQVGRSKVTILAMVTLSAFLVLSLILPSLSSLNDTKVALFSSGQSGSLALVGSQWVGGSAVPGDTNRELNISILNLNPFEITGVREQLNLTSVPLSNSTGGSISNGFVSSVLRTGQAGSSIIMLNVLSNGATFFPNPVYVPMTVLFLNNASQSESVGISVPVYLFPGRAQLSASPLATSIAVKGVGNVSFSITNSGKLPAISPMVTLGNLASGLVATENQPSTNISEISAGGSSIFSWEVAAGKGINIGTYPGTLSVTYNDPTGATYSTSFPVALSITGSVSLNIQGLVVVQNLDNLTVKGSVVNFGTAQSSFTQVAAYLRPSSSLESNTLGNVTGYLGNIGAGRTAYFTLVVPYPQQASQLSTVVNVTLLYQIGSGSRLQVSSVVPFTLQDSSSLQHAPGLPQTLTIEIAIGIVVAIVVVVSLIAVVRRRKSPHQSSKPQKTDEKIQVL